MTRLAAVGRFAMIVYQVRNDSLLDPNDSLSDVLDCTHCFGARSSVGVERFKKNSRSRGSGLIHLLKGGCQLLCPDLVEQ